MGPEPATVAKVATREQILDAARELFAAQGYEAVGMRRIAERVRVTPTALYHHFADKATLFRELCRTDFLALAREFGQIAAVADPVERLRLAGYAYVDFALAHPNHYRLMFMTPGPASDPAEMPHKDNPEEDAYAFARAAAADAIAAGRLRPDLADAEAVAQLAWAGAHGLVSLYLAKQHDPWVDWRPARETARRLIDVVMDGLTR